MALLVVGLPSSTYGTASYFDPFLSRKKYTVPFVPKIPPEQFHANSKRSSNVVYCSLQDLEFANLLPFVSYSHIIKIGQGHF